MPILKGEEVMAVSLIHVGSVPCASPNDHFLISSFPYFGKYDGNGFIMAEETLCLSEIDYGVVKRSVWDTITEGVNIEGKLDEWENLIDKHCVTAHNYDEELIWLAPMVRYEWLDVFNDDLILYEVYSNPARRLEELERLDMLVKFMSAVRRTWYTSGNEGAYLGLEEQGLLLDLYTSELLRLKESN